MSLNVAPAVGAANYDRGVKMTTATHTPGPLSVVQHNKWPFDILTVDGAGNEIFREVRKAAGSSQSTVAEVMSGQCFKGKFDRDSAIAANGRQLADAKLRAAAPDLLEALTRLLDDDEANLTLQGRRNLARAAIAKATAQ